MGCRETKAKGWALRCHLEMQQHGKAAFVTLTYDPEHEPVTLNKRHLQLFIKRIRKRLTSARPIRFFAAGEYGEANGRPHLHSIIYGMAKDEAKTIQEAWPHGYAQTEDAGPGAIAYVAGYAAKKYGDNKKAQEEQVDPETGEVYHYQPPFLQMSIKPGIGALAKDQYTDSWRNVAVLNGQKQAVPRYLHNQWRKTATPEQIEKLENEKAELMKIIMKTQKQNEAEAEIAIAKQRQKADRRKL